VNFNHHLHHDPWAGLGVFKLGEPGCQEKKNYICVAGYGSWGLSFLWNLAWIPWLSESLTKLDLPSFLFFFCAGQILRLTPRSPKETSREGMRSANKSPRCRQNLLLLLMLFVCFFVSFHCSNGGVSVWPGPSTSVCAESDGKASSGRDEDRAVQLPVGEEARRKAHSQD